MLQSDVCSYFIKFGVNGAQDVVPFFFAQPCVVVWEAAEPQDQVHVLRYRAGRVCDALPCTGTILGRDELVLSSRETCHGGDRALWRNVGVFRTPLYTVSEFNSSGSGLCEGLVNFTCFREGVLDSAGA